MTAYWTQLRYSGEGSAEIELRHDGRHWLYRVLPTNLWFFGGRTKFDAMQAASHHCGRSQMAMNWQPVREAGAA